MNGKMVMEIHWSTKQSNAGDLILLFISFILALILKIYSFAHGVEVLAKKGANVNQPNPLVQEDAYVDGGAPLHLAAMVIFFFLIIIYHF